MGAAYLDGVPGVAYGASLDPLAVLKGWCPHKERGRELR